MDEYENAAGKIFAEDESKSKEPVEITNDVSDLKFYNSTSSSSTTTESSSTELPELFIYTENSYKVKKDTLEALKDYKDKKYNFYLWDMKKLIETGKYKIVYEDESLIELIKNLKDPNQPAPAPSNNSSDNSGGGGYSDGNGGGGSQSSTGTNTTTQDTGTSTDKKNIDDKRRENVEARIAEKEQAVDSPTPEDKKDDSKNTSLESPYSFLDNYNKEKNGDTDGDNGDSIDFDYDKFLASWKVALEVQESLNNSYSGLNNVNTNIALSSGVSSVGDLSGAKACLNGACGCSGSANINGLLDTYKRLNDTYIKVDEENARKFNEWNKNMYPEQFGDSEDEEDSYNQATALMADLRNKAIDSGYADVDEFVKTLDEEQQKEYEKAKETISAYEENLKNETLNEKNTKKVTENFFNGQLSNIHLRDLYGTWENYQNGVDKFGNPITQEQEDAFIAAYEQVAGSNLIYGYVAGVTEKASEAGYDALRKMGVNIPIKAEPVTTQKVETTAENLESKIDENQFNDKLSNIHLRDLYGSWENYQNGVDKFGNPITQEQEDAFIEAYEQVAGSNLIYGYVAGVTEKAHEAADEVLAKLGIKGYAKGEPLIAAKASVESEPTYYGVAKTSENDEGIQVLKDTAGNYYWKDKNGEMQPATVLSNGDVKVGGFFGGMFIKKDGEERLIDTSQENPNAGKSMSGSGMSQAYENTSQGLESQTQNTSQKDPNAGKSMSGSGISQAYENTSQGLDNQTQNTSQKDPNAGKSMSGSGMSQAYENTSQGLESQTQEQPSTTVATPEVASTESSGPTHYGYAQSGEKQIEILKDDDGNYYWVKDNGKIKEGTTWGGDNVRIGPMFHQVDIVKDGEEQYLTVDSE